MLLIHTKIPAVNGNASFCWESWGQYKPSSSAVFIWLPKSGISLHTNAAFSSKFCNFVLTLKHKPDEQSSLLNSDLFSHLFLIMLLRGHLFLHLFFRHLGFFSWNSLEFWKCWMFFFVWNFSGSNTNPTSLADNEFSSSSIIFCFACCPHLLVDKFLTWIWMSMTDSLQGVVIHAWCKICTQNCNTECSESSMKCILSRGRRRRLLPSRPCLPAWLGALWMILVGRLKSSLLHKQGIFPHILLGGHLPFLDL